MVLGISTAQSALTGVAMKETVVQKHKGISRPNESELTLVPQNGNGPDPRLVEFVRLLARRAAQERYEQSAQEHRSKNS
jgi:hypothetical protein